MKWHRSDRGFINIAILAPIVAAVIGGAAAVGATAQIVHLASSSSDSSPATSQTVQYGSR
jgi:hypothetical protein